MSVTLQPAGKLEEFFIAIATLKTTPAQVKRIFADHEVNVVVRRFVLIRNNLPKDLFCDLGYHSTGIFNRPIGS